MDEPEEIKDSNKTKRQRTSKFPLLCPRCNQIELKDKHSFYAHKKKCNGTIKVILNLLNNSKSKYPMKCPKCFEYFIRNKNSAFYHKSSRIRKNEPIQPILLTPNDIDNENRIWELRVKRGFKNFRKWVYGYWYIFLNILTLLLFLKRTLK